MNLNHSYAQWSARQSVQCCVLSSGNSVFLLPLPLVPCPNHDRKTLACLPSHLVTGTSASRKVRIPTFNQYIIRKHEHSSARVFINDHKPSGQYQYLKARQEDSVKTHQAVAKVIEASLTIISCVEKLLDL
jgi:hypothetical protein